MTGVLEASSSLAMPQDVSVLKIPAFDGESEEALALRYGRKAKLKEDLVFEFTRDPALIHQYVKIYESECEIYPEIVQAEEEFNRNGHVLVIRQGSHVVGGARLYINSPRLKRRMLMEIAGFDIHAHFPQLEQKQMTYSEISRLVVLPDFRTLDVLRRLFIQLYRKGVAFGVGLSFAAAYMANVRSYRMMLNSIGVKKCVIHNEIKQKPTPGFENVNYYLLSIDPEISAEDKAKLMQEVRLSECESSDVEMV